MCSSDLSATGTVSVSVTAVNDAPVANDKGYSATEDVPLTVAAPGVLANETDVDGDPLTAILVHAPAKGTLSLNADGGFTYTPGANVNGSDAFTYRVSDGTADSNTATVTLTIGAINDAPVAENDTATTPDETAVAIPVLVNDSDVDGDSLSVISIGAVAHGSVDISADGRIIYTPDPEYYGADTLTYTISDGHGGTATATVNVTVTLVDEPPVAVDDSAATPEDTLVTLDVLANDHDPDGDIISIVSVAKPTHGIVVFEGDTITYIPAADYNGTDSFTYTVYDGKRLGATATVHVSVTPVNDDPVAVADTATTPEDAAVSIAVLANDSDREGDPLSVMGVSAPSHGDAVVNANGTITYPAPGP